MKQSSTNFSRLHALDREHLEILCALGDESFVGAPTTALLRLFHCRETILHLTWFPADPLQENQFELPPQQYDQGG